MNHPAMRPPLLTADLPGVGGRVRVCDEDFEVEEVPSYEPCGTGDHLFLWIEKRGIAPEFFARGIAQRLGTHPGNVGTAGLKDRHAVTRQWVSVPKECEPHLAKLDSDGVRVLKTGRHTNKLKPGHLRGNKFSILIREAKREPLAAPPEQAILDRIRALGLPNFYGPQRFGRDGGTVDLGLQCLAGKAPRRIRPFLFKFALSAVQSLLFNDYLARRVTDGLFRAVLDGDVMTKWPFGGMFVAQDVAAEQTRFDARETVTAGPMFGARTFPAAGPAAEREAAVLAAHGLSVASFGGFGKLVQGTRRQNLVYLDDLTSAWEPDGLRLSFTLPAGSYATVLLAEVMKADITDDAAAPDDDGEGEQ
ncbi:MAG: tRNA pseudouridine(13) synthase TruD [Planctomycetes bacterium]|nr:tRNA pseudouridine(13) synthase TruD [Planctomycetota bacterium]